MRLRRSAAVFAAPVLALTLLQAPAQAADTSLSNFSVRYDSERGHLWVSGDYSCRELTSDVDITVHLDQTSPEESNAFANGKSPGNTCPSEGTPWTVIVPLRNNATLPNHLDASPASGRATVWISTPDGTAYFAQTFSYSY